MASGFWRRHWTTIALSMAALVALVVYVFVDRGRVSSREATRREGQLLPAWRRDDVSRLLVHKPGLAPLRLERDLAADAGPLDFRMLEPVESNDIDAVMVDHLLTALEFAPVVRKLEDAPAQFGEVAARVEIAMGAVQYAFELGGDASVPAGARYLAVTRASGAASDVLGTYVVPASFVGELLVSAHDYRSKQIVPYLSIGLDAVEVMQKGQPPLRLDRIDNVSFRIAESGVRASRKRIDAIWASLAETRIESFAESPVEEAALEAAVADPLAVVVLHPQQGARAELRYGGACPGHPEQIAILRTTPTRLLACVPGEAQSGLAIAAEVLADRGLFALYLDEIAELSAVRGDVRLELVREGSGFRRRHPGSGLLDANQQASFDATLAFLFAEHGARALSATPSFERSASLRVVGGRGAPGGGELVEDIELGACAIPPRAAVPCVLRKGDGAHVLLPAAAMMRAMPTLDWLKSADLGLPDERASAIELDCGTRQRLLREAAGYRYELPAHAAIDEGRALELADALRRLRASGYVHGAAAVDADFALASCRIALTPAADSGAPIHIELGWDAGGNHVLGRIRGRSELWLAEAELRTLAERIYLRRTFWNEAAAVEEVTLRLGGGPSRSVQLGDAGNALLEAASAFRASEVLHLGPARADEGFGRAWLTLEARSGAIARQLQVASEPTASGALVRFAGVDATFSASVETLAPLLRAARGDPELEQP